MQREPTAGVKGAKPRLPRLKPAKEEIPRLSREYLEIRNEQMRCKQQKAAMELAERRGQLIERKLVEFQASYLLIVMRQKMLAEPVTLARRLVQEGYLEEKHQHEGRELIKADLCAMLAELASLPERVADASWLERVAEEQGAGGGAPVAKAGKRGRRERT